MNTAWRTDDTLVNLTEEIAEVKRFYGVPHLNHVPDFELVPMAHAVEGDLVALKNGAVGIVFEVYSDANCAWLAIVVNNGRVIYKQIA